MELVMSIDTELGYMKGTVEAMDTRLTKVETKVDSIDEKVDTILQKMSETKGEWKMISIIASISGTIGAVLVKLMHWIGVLH
jgi:phage shock protein A